jgi:hypothetical protein
MAYPPLLAFSGRRYQPLTAFCTVYIQASAAHIKAWQATIRLELKLKDDGLTGRAARHGLPIVESLP